MMVVSIRSKLYLSASLLTTLLISGVQANPDANERPAFKRRVSTANLFKDVTVRGEKKRVINFKEAINLDPKASSKKGEGVKTFVIDYTFNPFLDHFKENLTDTYFAGSPKLGTNAQIAAKKSAEASHHGNHVTDTMRQVAPSGKFRVFDIVNNANSTKSDEIFKQAIQQAINSKARFINVSLSFSTNSDNSISPGVRKAFLAAKEAGIVIFKSAGNDAELLGRSNYSRSLVDLVKEMNGYMYLVGNVAYTEDGTEYMQETSNTAGMASKYYVCAPGTDILAKDAKGNDMIATGTSMATPVVTGVAQNLQSDFPTLSNKEIAAILVKSARKKNLDHNHLDESIFGQGVIDFNSAKQLATLESQRKATVTAPKALPVLAEKSTGQKVLDVIKSVGHNAIEVAQLIGEAVSPTLKTVGSKVVSAFKSMKSWFGY